jgi:hypothetical protein
MIARIWKGAVRKQDGDAYARYMQQTGVAGYARVLATTASGCFAAMSTTGPSS